MKKNILSFFLILIAHLGFGQIVNIPDANFKAYLLADTNINANQDTEIQVSEANAFSGTIDVSSYIVSDLTGIEAFTALTILDCDGSGLISLNLSNNVALTHLICTYNALDSLDVSNNAALIQLRCGRNNMSSLDISNTSALIELRCEGNNLDSLDVSNCTALMELECYENNLISLDLSNNGALNRLVCDDNNLTNLDLSNNTMLTYLRCRLNNLSSLDVSNNTLLSVLFCDNNNITHLDFSNNDSLDALVCINNDLRSLDIRNGNNTIIHNFDFHTTNNPNLFCVNVDDPIWSAANWTYIDPQTSFSDNCCSGNLQITIDSIAHVTCGVTGFVATSASGGSFPYYYAWNTTTNDTNATVSVNDGGFYAITVIDDSSCSITQGALVNGPINSGGFDLKANLFGGVFRPGRIGQVNLHAFNDWCTPISGQLKVLIRGQASFDSADITPNMISNDTLIWNFSNWDADTMGLLTKLYIAVDTLASIGERICFEVTITPIAGDADTTNNRKLYCFDVRNSYDPNDKQVYPAGACAENYTLKEEKLEYTIRFQNTGNADAIDIYILDTLSAHVDVNSLQLLSVSHEPMITELLEDSIVKFRFDNIHLPDSFSNEEASHGYINYQISPHTGLLDGTEITNRVAIYFDFNPPVLTNTTLNTMVSTVPSPALTSLNGFLGTGGYTLNGQTYTNEGTYYQHFYAVDGCDSIVQLNLSTVTSLEENKLSTPTTYPNPFSNHVDILFSPSDHKNAQITLFDMSGKRHQVRIENQGSGIRLNGSNLESGIYMVQISRANGSISRVKIVKN